MFYLVKFNMFIRKTQIKDLPFIEEVYARARKFMKSSGNPGQWGDKYPPMEKLLRDIELGQAYICFEGKDILAVFSLCAGPDATYAHIEGGSWLNDKPYHVIHRLASSGLRRGAGAFCIDWCFKRSGNIRIDTHADNKPMLKLIAEKGFIYCGVIRTDDGTPRKAFQKDIEE